MPQGTSPNTLPSCIIDLLIALRCTVWRVATSGREFAVASSIVVSISYSIQFLFGAQEARPPYNPGVPGAFEIQNVRQSAKQESDNKARYCQGLLHPRCNVHGPKHRERERERGSHTHTLTRTLTPKP